MMGKDTCWQGLIVAEMDRHKDSFDNMERSTLSEEGLLELFDAGFGSPEGAPFTLWTTRRVYFPVVYDGSECVGSAPRDPCDEVTQPVGGW